MIKQLLKKYKKQLQIFGFSLLVIGYLYVNSLNRLPQSNINTKLVTPSITPSVNPSVKSSNLPISDSYNYNQKFDKLITDYPWYPSLPLETSEYRVIFDFEKNQFRIRVLDSNLTGSTKQLVIDNALSDMEKIGIDNSKFKHYTLP